MGIRMTSRELGADGLAVSLTISLALGLALIALGLLVVPSATATVYTNGGASSGILELMVYSCFSILLVGVIITLGSTLNLIGSFSKSQEERSRNSWLVKLGLITRDRSLRKVRVYGSLLTTMGSFMGVFSVCP